LINDSPVGFSIHSSNFISLFTIHPSLASLFTLQTSPFKLHSTFTLHTSLFTLQTSQEEAIKRSGKNIPMTETIVGVKGDLLSEKTVTAEG
jgi:type II secretory pathway predicted ATPase ExeA